MNKQILQLIGKTPLIKIDLGIKNAIIYTKLEGYNLSGSIKDRMALFILNKAYKSRLINKETTIIEATTGNTGISFALLSKIFGYKMIVVMPENQSQERIKLVKLYGAKIFLTPGKKGPQGAIDLRNRLLKKISNSWTPDQFNNQNNSLAYKTGLAQEVISQIDEPIDYFIHGIGTGGTLMGIGKVFKKNYPKIKIVAVEPSESAVITGKKPGPHNIQGIGEGFIPKIVNLNILDQIITVSTQEANDMIKLILHKTGLFVGFSSGANVVAIKKVASKIKKPTTFLTIFADRGDRYLSLL